MPNDLVAQKGLENTEPYSYSQAELDGMAWRAMLDYNKRENKKGKNKCILKGWSIRIGQMVTLVVHLIGRDDFKYDYTVVL